MGFRNAFRYPGTLLRLGISNVAYVAWYRFTLKSGIRKYFFPEHPIDATVPFFRSGGSRADCPDRSGRALTDAADRMIRGQLRYYVHHWKTVGNPPDWFLNPFNGRRFPAPQRHWTVLGDFDGRVGDIKNVWEASRFEWVATLARAYATSGDPVYLDTLNQWLRDWVENNPVNIGPNWKCGQEASIRVFNLVQAATILGQEDSPSRSLMDLVFRHLERIGSNIRYAVAQDNNHGTSEAAALFIGGHWCLKGDPSGARREKCEDFARKGRGWLENRVGKLVEEDGSFSQHSVTYHRVLLDTLTFAEHWRRRFGVGPFSATFYQRAGAAVDWLFLMTDAESGAAPNLGDNDGTMLLHAHDCDYRDFRPSVQTASVLFHGRKRYADGPWDEPAGWFGLKGDGAGNTGRERISRVLQGGYVIMAGEDSWGMVRFPMYRFRPGHNDVFHFDLWYRGENICRDGGSYSYNPEAPSDRAYFGSVKAHNTIGFDDDEQMPRAGRFLLGDWIKAEHVGGIETAGDATQCWTGSYKDYRGNRHQRKITWKGDEWSVEDTVSGAFDKAEITFRLPPGAYRVEGNRVAAPWGKIDVSGPVCGMAMSKGFESLYYWVKQPVDTLVLRAGAGCRTITTVFTLGKKESGR